MLQVWGLGRNTLGKGVAMAYIGYMGGKQPTHHNNPQRTMFFPHSTPEQLKVDMANSAKEVMGLTPSQRHGELNDCFGRRIHELMHYRTHTVDTDGF